MSTDPSQFPVYQLKSQPHNMAKNTFINKVPVSNKAHCPDVGSWCNYKTLKVTTKLTFTDPI